MNLVCSVNDRGNVWEIKKVDERLVISNIKRYLINHLISTILYGQCFVFLFCQRTEQPQQGNMNTRDAIPNTIKEVRYQIKLDPEGLMLLSFGRADGVDGCESYHMVVEHLLGRKFERNEENCFLKCCGVSAR
jgi:hypothetical protein